ncbi:amidohydrolase family protein [Steroidobacter agaridevorans]|uniref:amidohydrolase family protein n=1 Tax=Steroidobacter agaridevorans TaxID=2695856 RepID=UPI00132BE62B|nr:amidohydrolase family protein [Steroidobacter agaridevorans]GFE87028.1 Xaa-Pro dipeptidase [Steroidobacter agaridevorans]
MSNRCLGVLLVALTGIVSSVAQAQQAWTLDGVKIYPAPNAPPVSGHVIIAGNKIESVTTGKSRATAENKHSQCDGGVIVAGFQNSHVHFTGEEFSNARQRPAAELDAALTRMLTRYGYTTVFDVASDGENTLALRSRIEKGELRGPRILTVGLALFPPHGLPIYISHMPKELLDRLPQPDSADAAAQIVRKNLDAGTDGTKLFIATPQGDGTNKRMPADIASAAVQETHRRGKLVFAHPTDIQGIQDALAAHVDILTHPPLGAPAPWPEPLMKQLRDAGVSMTPTLQLFPYELNKQRVPADIAERLVNETLTEFGKFATLGGQVLFGTDVGYMTDYDPTREYELLAKAGMTPMQMLASLTTTPAARWNEQDSRGRIAAGMAADLVVLDADPADSPRNFASVRCAIRGGEVIYSRR